MAALRAPHAGRRGHPSKPGFSPDELMRPRVGEAVVKRLSNLVPASTLLCLTRSSMLPE
jgi:hypothetical protein